jgi:aryl-alcohol dehydrogenase-like predicted oxidoreductase
MGMSGYYGDPSSLSEAESIATIKAALDAGINFFDTADIYGLGNNEKLLGKYSLEFDAIYQRSPMLQIL